MLTKGEGKGEVETMGARGDWGEGTGEEGLGELSGSGEEGTMIERVEQGRGVAVGRGRRGEGAGDESPKEGVGAPYRDHRRGRKLGDVRREVKEEERRRSNVRHVKDD
ncbi:hypothetical protein Dimus_028719, partial [Dionaea muscipula]